jgi:hypothetical protein
VKKRECLVDFKDFFKGRAVVVVGNSPFLNMMHLDDIFRDYFTFCCNRFYLWNKENYPVFPTFYTIADERMFSVQEKESIIATYNYQTEIILPSVHPNPQIIPTKVWQDTRYTIFYEQLLWGGTYYDGKRIGLGGTTANVMVQLAYWLGFSEIIFLGVDFDYSKSLSDNHFSKDYFDETRGHGAPDIDTGFNSLVRTIKTFSSVKFSTVNERSKLIEASIPVNNQFFDRYRRK